LYWVELSHTSTMFPPRCRWPASSSSAKCTGRPAPHSSPASSAGPHSSRARLREALETGDIDAVRLWANRLEGSCGTVGAVRVAELCQDLDVADARQPWTARDDAPLPATLMRSADEMRRATQELRSRC
jgi:hypothetical protein